MTSWPPRDEAIWRAPAVETTRFERIIQRAPKPPRPEPPGIALALIPPPGVPTLWCLCGSAIPVEHEVQRSEMERQYLSGWRERHAGLGHRVVADHWRAPCRPTASGCRQCGEPPVGRLRFYCSDAHRTVFDRDHFWPQASAAALVRQSVFDLDGPRRSTRRLARYICGRCEERISGTPEVNHRVPLNGVRPSFGCGHHQSNLEVLCHACHVRVTAEQRAAGLIGRRS